MLPTVETLNPGVGGAPIRRPDAEKALEAYKAQPASGQLAAKRDAVVAAPDDREQTPRTQSAKPRSQTDRIEINLQLSVEERDAFLTAFSSKQDPDTMSPEEKETLQKASERISKFIDDAITRNSDNRERVEKALTEWYSRISRGEERGPTDLIQLLRQAAMGDLDKVPSS